MSTEACEYLTVKQAAELMGVSPKTVYKAVYARRMPGVVRFGRAVRIHRPAVERQAQTGQVLEGAQ